MLQRLVAMLAATFPLLVMAAAEGPGVDQRLQAVRTAGKIRVDGRLDEPDWAAAPAFGDFVQRFPNEGAPPSEQTEVRVLYDDSTLYVGVHCHDSQPALIVKALGRRDNLPVADTVHVMVDSRHDHQTAYRFSVNAAGTVADTLLFSDSNSTNEWDAVWEAEVATLPDGWSAELAIPLSLLRFPDAEVQTWGFGVEREIARLHEEDWSVLIPRNARGLVSRLGHVTGLSRLRRPARMELMPFVATRSVLRPQYSSPSQPNPRLLDPSADVGLDINASLTNTLSLSGTVNPDFGQVEADQIILNLTNQEEYFPEKRPFFLQGMELFQPPGDVSTQMLFYSRRIGLDQPILGAAKVTGAVLPGLEVGVLDALVMGPSAAQDEANPNRDVGLHPERPLHVGLEDELPPAPTVPRNFAVAMVRKDLGGSSVGAQFASGMPLAPVCTDADAHSPSPPVQCAAAGGNAAATSWDLRTPDGQWGTSGQLDASQTVGGPPEQVLRDGTVLARGATGLGAYLSAGKYGGAPFRFSIDVDYQSPTLELNAVGYQPVQNSTGIGAIAYYTRPAGWGPLRAFNASARLYGNWSTDGRWVDLGRSAGMQVSMLLPSFDQLGVDLSVGPGLYTLREIPQTGIPVERPGTYAATLFGGTDANRPVWVNGSVALRGILDAGPTSPLARGWSGNLNLAVRPAPALETRLTVTGASTPYAPRWRGLFQQNEYLFGTLRTYTGSLTLRQQVALTPRLTLQVYAQLFSALGRYGAFFAGASADRSAIALADLTPVDYAGSKSFHLSSLALNAVLRWEYRPGSTLFFVYTRSQSERPATGTPLPSTVWPGDLFGGPTVDAVMVKWSYWLGL